MPASWLLTSPSFAFGDTPLWRGRITRLAKRRGTP